MDGIPVTAFVGLAPRGPVDRAVRVRSLAEFDKCFGAPGCSCRMESAIRQFFLNGGINAVVVRVCGTRGYSRIRLPGEQGEWWLEARNPGPLEHLRASVDYDGLAVASTDTFNLVVQRLRTAGSAWIEAQEVYRGVSIDPVSRDFVGRVLDQSDLVRITGTPPGDRPCLTIRPGSLRESGYISGITAANAGALPDDYDLVGSPTAGTGLNALDCIADLGQLCLLSGGQDAAIGPVALLAADRYCRERQALLIIDPPDRWQDVETVLRDQRRSDFASPNAVTWYPCTWLRNSSSERVQTSAAGAIAAALMTDYRTRDLARLPDSDMTVLRAGIQSGPEPSRTDTLRLARAGVNILVRRSALHMQLQGNVTQARHTGLLRSGDTLTGRRDLLFILRRLRIGTRWVRIYASTPQLWQEVREQAGNFLHALQSAHLLAANQNRPAFSVQCDQSTNAGFDGRTGEVCMVVCLALFRPDEYFSFRLQQSPAGCHISELGTRSTLALTG